MYFLVILEKIEKSEKGGILFPLFCKNCRLYFFKKRVVFSVLKNKFEFKK